MREAYYALKHIHFLAVLYSERVCARSGSGAVVCAAVCRSCVLVLEDSRVREINAEKV